MTKPAAKPRSNPSAAKNSRADKAAAAPAKAAPAPAKTRTAGRTVASSAPPAAKTVTKNATKPAAKAAPKAAVAVVAAPALAPKAVAKLAPKAVPKAVPKTAAPQQVTARLTLSSRNYSSWSLRGYLMTKFAGLATEEVMVAPDDPDSRAELLLLSPSILVPMLEHEGLKIWDVIAIGEYLAERFPEAGLLPADPQARARCRSICGEIHSGFASLRSALPVNLRMRHSQFKVWSRAQADLDRIFTIWQQCLDQYGGPYLFGARSMADAMYAPVVTRLRTYDVPVPPGLTGYCGTILSMPEMLAWEAAALAEPDQLQEFDVEF